MPKVIKIQTDTIVLGMDDGSLREVRQTDCTFVPTIGDEVEIYENESTIIITKVGQPIQETTIEPLSPQPHSQKQSPLVAIVFGALLGHFGAHNFYLHNSKRAFLQLALCLITPIVFLLEPLVLIFNPLSLIITLPLCLFGYIYLWLWVGIELIQICRGKSKNWPELIFFREYHKVIAVLLIIVYWLAFIALIFGLVYLIGGIIIGTIEPSLLPTYFLIPYLFK